MRDGDGPQSPTAYCPACWGAGELYRIPARADGEAHSCSACSPPVEDWEPYPCARCAGTGLIPTGSPAAGEA